MKIVYVCQSCGNKQYSNTLEYNDEDNFITCEKCGDMMIIDFVYDESSSASENTQDLSNLIIAQLKQDIATLGVIKVWEIIEAFPNAQTRVKYRKYFLQAGGQIPEVNLLLENFGKLYLNREIK